MKAYTVKKERAAILKAVLLFFKLFYYNRKIKIHVYAKRQS